MHAYGLFPHDRSRPLGHQKFPAGRYYNNSKCNARRRRTQKHRKTRARMEAAQMIRQILTTSF